MVIAKLRCRLRKPEPKQQTQVYLRSKCMEPGVQSAIQKDLKGPVHITRLAHQALDESGTFGIETSYHWTRHDPPQILIFTRDQQRAAVGHLVTLGDQALVRTAQQHDPIPDSETRSKQLCITAPTRSLALVKGCVLQAHLRIRRFGHNTLAKAVFEALRAYRQVSMLERGTICGFRGQRLTASQNVLFL